MNFKLHKFIHFQDELKDLIKREYERLNRE